MKLPWKSDTPFGGKQLSLDRRLKVMTDFNTLFQSRENSGIPPRKTNQRDLDKQPNFKMLIESNFQITLSPLS